MYLIMKGNIILWDIYLGIDIFDNYVIDFLYGIFLYN